MKKRGFINFVFAIIALNYNHTAFGQCAANSTLIYSFEYANKTYEIVKVNATWSEARSCAHARGGKLAEINSVAEQNAIFTQLTSNAGINVNSTMSPSYGGAFVWLGANDLATEGEWVWGGYNNGNGTQFWMGTASGTQVGGLYNNWQTGVEPSNLGGEDVLALSLNGWPIGSAGRWASLSGANQLYYVIEYPTILLSLDDNTFSNTVKLFPNPVTDFLTIEAPQTHLKSISITNTLGQTVKTISIQDNTMITDINLTDLTTGVYFVKVTSKTGLSVTKKIIK